MNIYYEHNDCKSKQTCKRLNYPWFNIGMFRGNYEMAQLQLQGTTNFIIYLNHCWFELKEVNIIWFFTKLLTTNWPKVSTTWLVWKVYIREPKAALFV